MPRKVSFVDSYLIYLHEEICPLLAYLTFKKGIQEVSNPFLREAGLRNEIGIEMKYAELTGEKADPEKIVSDFSSKNKIPIDLAEDFAKVFSPKTPEEKNRETCFQKKQRLLLKICF